jgi:hypothetical protein
MENKGNGKMASVIQAVSSDLRSDYSWIKLAGFVLFVTFFGGAVLSSFL